MYLMVGKQEYEERVLWLKSLYGNRNQHNQPSRMKRFMSRVLFITGQLLVSLGERMQQPRHDIPATFPAMK
jgi:hypothetical protein